MFSMVGFFNGCGKTTFVMVQGIIGAFLIRIPVAYVMSKIVPVSLFNVGLATPISTFVQVILCGIYFIFYSKHTSRKNLENTAVDNIGDKDRINNISMR